MPRTFEEIHSDMMQAFSDFHAGALPPRRCYLFGCIPLPYVALSTADVMQPLKERLSPLLEEWIERSRG